QAILVFRHDFADVGFLLLGKLLAVLAQDFADLHLDLGACRWLELGHCGLRLLLQSLADGGAGRRAGRGALRQGLAGADKSGGGGSGGADRETTASDLEFVHRHLLAENSEAGDYLKGWRQSNYRKTYH